jgi:hypothetical protein
VSAWVPNVPVVPVVVETETMLLPQISIVVVIILASWTIRTIPVIGIYKMIDVDLQHYTQTLWVFRHRKPVAVAEEATKYDLTHLEVISIFYKRCSYYIFICSFQGYSDSLCNQSQLMTLSHAELKRNFVSIEILEFQ